MLESAQTLNLTESRKTGGYTSYNEVTLTLDTSAYAANDVLADTQEIANAVRYDGGTGIIHSCTLLDKDDNGEAIDVYFLRTNVSMGTKNSAISITDANADEILGFAEILAADYKDLVASQLAQATNLGITARAATDSTSLYVAAVLRSGTPTYTASGITLKIGILQD